MMLEIQVLAWDSYKFVVGLNRLMRSQPSPLDNWISNGNTCSKSLLIIIQGCVRLLAYVVIFSYKV